MEKSVTRKQSERFSAEEVKELFYSIDKDRSGEISKHVTHHHHQQPTISCALLSSAPLGSPASL